MIGQEFRKGLILLFSVLSAGVTDAWILTLMWWKLSK